jgi:iron complex outermembrane receptor protein
MASINSGPGPWFAGVCALITVTSDAGAQQPEGSADAPRLEELVVTATRQSQGLNRVPISVTALSAQQMEDIGAKQVDDLVRQTPGIAIGRAGNSPLGATVTVRGISAGGVGAGTTGIYINDTPIQVRTIGFSSASTFPVIYDLARVEVLRGPQGTLFGAGAEGGAIRFITPEPSFDKFTGTARSEFSSTENGDPSYEAGVAAGGPLVDDKLAFRMSAYYRKDGGYVERIPQATVSPKVASDDNWTNAATGRLALAWRATDSLLITPSVAWQRQRSHGTSAFWERESDPQSGRFLNGNKFNEPFEDRFTLPALNVEWNLGAVDFISSTSYFRRRSFGVSDYTTLNAATHSGSGYLIPAIADFYARADQGNDQTNRTQELRLQSANPDARLNWVVGVFAERNEQTSFQRTVSPGFMTMWEATHPGRTFVSAFGRPLLPGGVYLLSTVEAVDEQLAAFAQADYGITDKLKATVGLRYADTKFTYDAAYDGPSNGPAFFTDKGGQSETPVTPKFGLSYQLNGDHLFYTSASKGFRPGGAQARNPPLCQPELTSLGYSSPPTTFDSDSVWSYEVGAKNRLLDGRLSLDTSVFYIDWTDIQRSVQLISCARNFVANLGTAVSKGFDLSAQVLIGDALIVGLSVGYTDAELSETVYGGSTAGGARRILVAKGDSLGQRPWKATLNLEQGLTLGTFDAFARLDYTYNDDQAETATHNPITSAYNANLYPEASYDTLNARIGLRQPSYDVALFVNNVTNEAPIFNRAQQSRTSPLYTLNTLTPRTIGVTAGYKF